MAACSGGSVGGSSAVPNAAAPGSNSASVRVSIVIPNPAPQTGARVRRQFVSPATQGVTIVVYAHTDTTHSSPLATNVANVSNGSSPCTSGGSGRTCTIALNSPTGNNDFVFTLYDAAPVSGTIPSTAHELGIADVTLNVTTNTQNVINAPISAIIAALGGSTQTVVENTDGSSHSVGLAIAPADFDDQPITAGSSDAPFANPINVTVSEAGDTGHTKLSLDGGTPSASVTVNKATDTVSAVYDGKAKPGYSATVTATAPAYNGGGGATQENLQMNTLAVSNPTVFYALGPATLKTYPAGEHLLSIAESGASASTTYTATASGCANILQPGTVVGKGANASLIVLAGTQTSSGGCSLAISDGTTSFNVAVTNEFRTAPTNPTIAEHATSASGPFGITTGPDGNLWFTDLNSAAIDTITPSFGTALSPIPAGGFSAPFGISIGPDGTLWFGDAISNLIGSVTTSGAITTYSQQTQNAPENPIAGLDGRVWFGEAMGAQMGVISPGNPTPIEFPIANGSGPQDNAIGSNQQIWFGLGATGVVYGPMGEIQTASPNAITQLTATTAQPPFALALGPDGAIWFTETGSDVGRIDTTGSLTEYTIPATYGAPSLNYIVAGPDGALWVADSGNNAIDRITPSGAITIYPVPTPNAQPAGITVGPDGNIWFTEYNVGQVGKLVLQ